MTTSPPTTPGEVERDPVPSEAVQSEFVVMTAAGELASGGHAVASQWQPMWWQFRRHRLAMASAVVLLVIYLVATFYEFIAPFDPLAFTPRYTYAPPSECISSTGTGRAT